MNGRSVTETIYRGYTLRVTSAGVLVYSAAGDFLETVASSAHARPVIDKWVDGTVR